MDIKADCPCKRVKCPRHGNCAACREHHHQTEKKSVLPACERLKAKEERKYRRER